MKLKHLAIATTLAFSLNTGKLNTQNPFLYKLDAKPPVQLMAENRSPLAENRLPFQLEKENRLPFTSENEIRFPFRPMSTIQPPLNSLQEAKLVQLPNLSKIPLPREVPVQKDHKSEWAGQIALLISVAAFGMQLGRNWKVKKQEDISLQAWITSFFVDSAWMVYGFASNISTIIVSNSLALVPRAYGIYQIIKGLSTDFKSALSLMRTEFYNAYEKIVRKNNMLDSWVWATVGDPINTLAVAATLPLYIQFRKTTKDLKTTGVSFGSQALYTLASVFWGINGYVFGKGVVVASCTAGLYFFGAVALAKYRDMKREGQKVGAVLAEETADTAMFVFDKVVTKPMNFLRRLRASLAHSEKLPKQAHAEQSPQ